MSFLGWLFRRKQRIEVRRPEISVIHDSLMNRPDEWHHSGIGTVVNREMSVRLENAIEYHRLGLRLNIKDVRVDLSCSDSVYLRGAINYWDHRRQERASNTLVQTDHTMRVKRIMEARALLQSEDAKDILRRLDAQK